MYVCVCKAVTEGQVYRAIQSGAHNLRLLRDQLGVASECGRCAGCARQCLRDAHRGASAAAPDPGSVKLPLLEAA